MKKKDFGLLMSMKRKKSTRKTKLEIKKWDSQLGNIREIMEYLKLRKKSSKYNKCGTDKKSTRISMSLKKKCKKYKSKSKNDLKKKNNNFLNKNNNFLTNLQNSRFFKKNKSIEIFKKKKSKNISLLKKNTSFNNLFILDANFGEFIRKKKKKEKKKSLSKKKRKKFLINCDFKISKLNNYLSNSYNKNKVVKKYLSIDPKSKLLKNMTQTSKYIKKKKNPIKMKLDNLKKSLKLFINKYKNFENENDLLKEEIMKYKVILKKKNYK